jgi:release factor glutamine methyltransferase
MELAVDARVLIPRPETEHLVEAALELMPGDATRAVDFGTGSGCIALALARERAALRVIAVDSSPGALQVAAANVRRHCPDGRISLLQARSPEVLGGSGWLDALISNPPYIPGPALAALPADVRQHEPVAALSPGPGGLELTARLVAAASRLLRPGGLLALEIDAPSAEGALALLAGEGWSGAGLRPDLAGRSRVLVALRSGAPA